MCFCDQLTNVIIQCGTNSSAPLIEKKLNMKFIALNNQMNHEEGSFIEVAMFHQKVGPYASGVPKQ